MERNHTKKKESQGHLNGAVDTVLTAKPDGLNSIPRAHMVERTDFCSRGQVTERNGLGRSLVVCWNTLHSQPEAFLLGVLCGPMPDINLQAPI